MKISYKEIEGLARTYGESFYLLNIEKFKNNYDEFLTAFTKIYPKIKIGYSYKTNYTPRLCSIINEKGGYAEVVSEMEYDLAIKIGAKPEHIIVNGPSKHKEALKKYLSKGSQVNIDSYEEAKTVKEIAQEHPDITLNIGLRCNFSINDTLISRFGLDVNDKAFAELIKELEQIKNIDLRGLHCHFPNRDLESFKRRAEELINVGKRHFKKAPRYLSIGGGYFGKMNEELKAQFNTKVPNYNEYAEAVAKKFFEAYNQEEQPTLILEPGSAIVADTMHFVTKVISIKNVQGKRIATTNGSRFNMSLLSSPINIPFTRYGKETSNKSKEITDIAGYTCIENDYLYKGYKGTLQAGDYLVFDNVGSYSIVFKPPFINPNVAIISYDPEKKTHTLVKETECMDDLFRTFIF